MKKQVTSKKENCKESEDYEIKFWEDWLKADTLKRLEMVNKLHLFKLCLSIKDEKMWKESFASLINGYFEDLEDACRVKYNNKTK